LELRDGVPSRVFCLAQESFMSRLVISFLATISGLTLLGAPLLAGEPNIPRFLHPWGTFETGAWKIVHVTTQSLDEQGHVVSSGATDTKTTLIELGNTGVKLEVDACMEVGGKQFQADPQIVQQGFYGEQTASGVVAKPAVDGDVIIEGRKIPCKVQEFEIADSNSKTNITLHYSSTVAPYVLKRESVTTDPSGKHIQSETKMEIVALDMPVLIQFEHRTGVYTKTVQKTPNGSVTTLALILPDVPGGVVRHSMKEVDKNDRVVRRSTLELVAYNNDANERLYRKRPNRRTKAPY
jgi:hypothetical protein